MDAIGLYIALVLLQLTAAPEVSVVTASATDSPKALKIALVGDSTVTDGSGWGLGFKKCLTDDVECINAAQNGRSSKSYRDEGR